MELIYQNFDGLDIAFQGIVPEAILNILEVGRQEAEISPRGKVPALVELGIAKVPVMVASTGLKGGYRYRFDTGLDGEIWCIANSDKRDQWNIRVSVKSLSLALYGYEGVRERINDMLVNLEATGNGNIDLDTGQIYELPKESISRIDYCFDFKSDNFVISPDLFIAHSRCNKAFLYPQEVIAKGRNISYSRIGEMPNKQVVIYNKTSEIEVKNKSYWWKIWGISKNDFNQKIWRVEVRAGKKELRKWPIRNYNDFEKKAGDVILSILEEIKYVSPNNADTNKARWPLAKFWQECQKAANNSLSPYISNSQRNPIIEEYRNNLINRYKNQMSGMLPAYAALVGETDAAHIPAVLEGLYKEFAENSKTNKSKIQSKIEKAKNKFIFLGEDN